MNNAIKYPKRKRNRLENFDYGQVGGYFVTICTKNRANLSSTIQDYPAQFSQDVGATIGRPSEVILYHCGEVAKKIH